MEEEQVKSGARDAFYFGFGRIFVPILAVLMGIGLISLIVHLLDYESLNKHFVGSIVLLIVPAVGLLLSIFFSPKRGRVAFNNVVFYRRAPAGIMALIFSASALFWWGQWQQSVQWGREIAELCKRRDTYEGNAAQWTDLDNKAAAKADQVNSLYFKERIYLPDGHCH
jgi:hypothetical protein